MASEASIGRSPQPEETKESWINNRTLGIQGLVKAFDIKDKYSGSYEEDL